MEYLWLTFDPGSGDFWCCPPLGASQPSLSLLWLGTGVSRMGRGRWQDSQRSLFPRKCLGCGTNGSGKRKWEEGRLRERGRWLQECDPESWSWPRGFPERFLPPSSLSPAACCSPACPAPAPAAPSPAQTGLLATSPHSLASQGSCPGGDPPALAFIFPT